MARQVDGVIRGLVKVVGNMVETGREKCVHWSSKAVRFVLEAVEGRINILHDFHIVRKMNYVIFNLFFEIEGHLAYQGCSSTGHPCIRES